MPSSVVAVASDRPVACADAQQLQYRQRCVFAPLPDFISYDPLLAPFDQDLYDAFRSAVDNLRALLRDALSFHQLIQEAKDGGPQATADGRGAKATAKPSASAAAPKQSLPSRVNDCCRAVHVYSAAATALAHCALTLFSFDARRHDADLAPGVNGITQRLAGVVDCLVLALLTTTTSLRDACKQEKDGRSAVPLSLSALLKRMNVQLGPAAGKDAGARAPPIGFDRSVLLAQRLAQCCLHVICDPATLQVVVLGRRRFLKSAVHPDAAMLSFKTQPLTEALAAFALDAKTNNAASKAENEATLKFVEQVDVADEAFHVLNQIELPLLRAAAASDTADADADAELFDKAMDQLDKEQRARRAEAQRRDGELKALGRRSREGGAARAMRRLGKAHDAAAPPAAPDGAAASGLRPAEAPQSGPTNGAQKNGASTAAGRQWQRKVAHFSQLKKAFREAFLVLDCLSPTSQTEAALLGGPQSARGSTGFVLPLAFGPAHGQALLTGDADVGVAVPALVRDLLEGAVAWRKRNFSPEFRPQLLPNPSARPHGGAAAMKPKRSLTEQVRHYEALCFHTYQCPERVVLPRGGFPVGAALDGEDLRLSQYVGDGGDEAARAATCFRPRLLEPCELSCHVLDAILDFLWGRCRAGEGLVRTREQQETQLVRQMQQLRARAPPKPSPAKASRAGRAGAASALSASASLPSLPRRGPPAALDLGKRLAQAKSAAQVEAKLHTMQLRAPSDADASGSLEAGADGSLFEMVRRTQGPRAMAFAGDELEPDAEDEEARRLRLKYQYDGDGGAPARDAGDEDAQGQSRAAGSRERPPLGKSSRVSSRPAAAVCRSVVWFHSKSDGYDVRTGRSRFASQGDGRSDSRAAQRKARLAAEQASDGDAKGAAGDWIKQMTLQHIQQVAQDARAGGETLGSFYDEEDHPLRGLPLPTAISTAYAGHLQTQKAQGLDEEAALHQQLQELQEKIVSENKVFRQRQLQLQRQQQLEDLQATQLVQQEYDARRVQLKQQQAVLQQQLDEVRRQREETERLRIADLQNMKRFQQMQQAEREQEELQMQLLMISLVQKQSEYEENLRRLREEQSMQAEERRRAVLEEKRLRKEREAAEAEQRRRAKVEDAVARAEHRVRRGNFVWHNGRFGYYDQVRPEEKLPAYVYYADQRAYFDPLTSHWQRRAPADGDVVTYEDEARRLYDAEHGEGAYDAYWADLNFKLGVNEQGGYYDDDGVWQVAYGYFDPEQDYAWVAYEGYYDEDTGKFVKYAKVQGDLSFMV